MARVKIDFPAILGYISSHPMEVMSLMALAAAISSGDQKQINKAAKSLIGILATDINTTDPDVKKALSDLSAALSK